MQRITVELEVITPMFLAGADGSTAELRAPSIKGLMRYWWRALQAEDYLENLRKNENQIFGDVKQGAAFSVRLTHETFKAVKSDLPSHTVTVPGKGKILHVDILKYLAYGTYSFKEGFTKERIPEGTKFRLIINVSNQNCEKDILRTLYIFDLFGGLGSRSRNGFGSISISNKTMLFDSIKTEWSIDKPYEKTNLVKIVKKIPTKSYSSFSGETRIFRAASSYGTWDKALAEVGKTYRKARTDLEPKHHYHKRQYIGAPISGSFLERHAKPYFLKIAREDKDYRAYILYLPSAYCNQLEKDIKGQKIEHDKVNQEFRDTCKIFNGLLSNSMEVIL